MARFLDSLGNIVGRRRTTRKDFGADRRTEDRRREPRYNLRRNTEGRVEVEVELLGIGTLHDVTDLSVGGLSLNVSKMQEAVQPGNVYPAHVYLGWTVIPVTLKVMNQRGESVGCSLVDPEPLWFETIASFLDPIAIGKRLREIDQKFVRQEEESHTIRWFQGGPACDLYAWQEGEELTKAQLFFAWRLVEWSKKDGLRTGSVSAPPTADRQKAKSDLFVLMTPADEETVSTGRRILEAAEIPRDIRNCFRAP